MTEAKIYIKGWCNVTLLTEGVKIQDSETRHDYLCSVHLLPYNIRGATFWAFFKNHDVPILNASILHQLTLKRPSDPKKNRRRNFPKPKTSNFGPILAYVQKKAHLAILKPPAGAMIVPNFWYWA